MPKEGQTATNPNTGERAVYQGGRWVKLAPGAVVPRKLSPTEQKALIAQQEGANTAAEVKMRTQAIAPSLKRLKGGPFRGTFLDMAIPTPQGGFFDKLGAAVIGAPARLIGAITPQEVRDYQKVSRAAVLATRQSETGEKGVQTEGDAARALLAGVSPSTADPDFVVRQINEKADRQIKRADFYTKWANRYGVTGTNEKGQTVEQAFLQSLNNPAPGTAKPRIRRIK